MAKSMKNVTKGFSTLTDGERQTIVGNLYVERDVTSEIYETIDHLRQRAKVIDEPKSLVLTGDTGMGKTTLLKTYLSNHSMSFVDNCAVRPVVYVSLPVRTTIRGAATDLLRAMEVPGADKGSLGDRTNLIVTQLLNQKVEVVLVDETQHVVATSGEGTLYDVGEFFKDLSKKSNVPLVLAGMPETLSVLSKNPQLRRLCRRASIGPFSAKNKDVFLSFRKFLGDLDKKLPFDVLSRFGDPEQARLIFAATDGMICHVMNLIRAAALLAIDDGSDSVCYDHLRLAFASELDSVVLIENNPFDPAFRQAALNAVNPNGV